MYWVYACRYRVYIRRITFFIILVEYIASISAPGLNKLHALLLYTSCIAMKIKVSGPRLLLVAVLLASQSLAKPGSKLLSENNVKEAFLMGLQLPKENGQ